MKVETLKALWFSLNHQYTSDTAKVESTFERIVQRYTHQSRHYHTLDHLSAMFGLLEEYQENIDDIDLLYYTVWFHDIVYRSLKKNNERKSAEEGKAYLRSIGYPENKIKHFGWLIIKTKNHMVVDESETLDDQLFLDSDLAILGRSKETYINYMVQVRKEYYWLPDIIYNSGRKKILKKMLDAPQLYRTPQFRGRFEKQAKENLRMEIEELS